jgi:glycosyltransferase involved in cell wall biosynthesis
VNEAEGGLVSLEGKKIITGMVGDSDESETNPPENRPMISVVVCTYNRVQWLPKCLRSLEEQDPHPDEIIVVDGPSNDGTRAMLELLEQQGHLFLVKQEHLDGISSARNLGLSRAKGDIVCFIDDDDIAQPGWLASIVASYDDPSVGGVGGPVLDMKGRLTKAETLFRQWGNGSTSPGTSPLLGCTR